VDPRAQGARSKLLLANEVPAACKTYNQRAFRIINTTDMHQVCRSAAQLCVLRILCVRGRAGQSKARREAVVTASLMVLAGQGAQQQAPHAKRDGFRARNIKQTRWGPAQAAAGRGRCSTTPAGRTCGRSELSDHARSGCGATLRCDGGAARRLRSAPFRRGCSQTAAACGWQALSCRGCGRQ